MPTQKTFMRKYLLITLLLAATLGYGQKYSIRGQLADTINAPLSSATVILLNANDSSLVNFSVSDVNGNFEIRNVSRGDLLFKVSYLGFRTYNKKVVFPETSAVVDLGKIKLEPVSSELEAIEVSAERAPVTVKRDTIEFNAGSFKTKQNAVVEDLLKKLPGVEVDHDGNVTAQGEQVKKVTVDGKNFFGTDPKLATRNLPADAVDKVQVFDKKSDQATFSGIDDGQREKTINLELKEEKRNGAFGTILGGAGTDERAQGRVSLNRFTRSRQVSFLGMGNNVNEQGFSMEEYMNFTGGSQQMMSGGGGVRLQFNGENQNGVPLNFGNRANGIMTNYAAGINVNNEFSKKTELNGSYFFNYLEHQKDQTTFRENFLPNGSYTFNQNSKQLNNNFNHRINATLEQKIDSMNSIKLTTTASYNETDMHLKSASENITPDGVTHNTSETASLTSGSGASVNSSLLWRHKFNKKGRTFSLNLQYGFTDSEREGSLVSENNFFIPEDSTAMIHQLNSQNSVYRSHGATFSYTEPLGKRRYLEGNYSYRQNLNDVDREVYDVNSGESIFNTSLSNQYNSDYEYHRAGLNYRIAKSKYNFVIGSSIQKTRLAGELKSSDINRSFQNILPALRFNYEFTNSRNLRFDYETSVQEPSIQQLQPVVDNSDPLNLYVGNPGLRPAYVQDWRLNFMTFDPATFFNFFSFLDVNYVTNAIVNAQTVNERLVRTTRPVNVGSTLRIYSNANVGFPINKIKSRFSFGINYRNERSLALLNDRENQIDQQSYGGDVRYSYRYKEIFDLSLAADIDRQLTSYEFNQPDQTFINQTYNAESNLTLLKNYQFSGSFEYLVYESQSTNFSQSIPLVNLSLSRFILKNKAGELKLAVNNLLDRALGVSQTASINYLERQTTNSLGRYFLLSFTYALNRQLNPMGMRRSGMMRIMR
jgi:outer membrane receptor protein involved in Fe transport